MNENESRQPTNSEQETIAHICRVQELLSEIRTALYERGQVHDASKLKSPEVEAFENVSSALRSLTYGSPEYRRILREELGVALEHHYANNSHHPEHWDTFSVNEHGDRVWHKKGIQQMSLLDQLEMLADWKAAGERHADGSLTRSFMVNRQRFGLSYDQFVQLVKTAEELGWLPIEDARILKAATGNCYDFPPPTE